MIECLRKRIDFISQLKDKGFSIAVPKESIQELKDIKRSPLQSKEEKVMVNEVMDIIKREKIEKKSAGQGKMSDWLLKQSNDGFYIGTQDSVLRRKAPNVVVINESNGIEIQTTERRDENG